MEEIAKMVGSAVVQEVVTGAIKFVRSNHEELASQGHLIERLKMAQLGKFSLERSKNMPITDVALLQTRMELRLAFEKCRHLLNKHTVLRRRPTSFSETYRRAVHLLAIDSPILSSHSFLKAKVYYRMVSGSQIRFLSIDPYFLEDYGAVATLKFKFEDLDTQMKSFSLDLVLRLSESTDIVGISSKCLQSLAPQFKHVADVALGELAQISTQVGFLRFEPYIQECLFDMWTCFNILFCPKPLCCIGDGYQPSSELTERFPKQVIYLYCECFISAHEYNLESSTIETNRNTIKAWPILELSVVLVPHFTWDIEDAKVNSNVYLSKMAELEPERAEYTMSWRSAHEAALFTVKKPTIEMGCASKVGTGSRTRRASKRKR